MRRAPSVGCIAAGGGRPVEMLFETCGDSPRETCCFIGFHRFALFSSRPTTSRHAGSGITTCTPRGRSLPPGHPPAASQPGGDRRRPCRPGSRTGHVFAIMRQYRCMDSFSNPCVSSFITLPAHSPCCTTIQLVPAINSALLHCLSRAVHYTTSAADAPHYLAALMLRPANHADSASDASGVTRLCHFIFRKVRFEPIFMRAA